MADAKACAVQMQPLPVFDCETAKMATKQAKLKPECKYGAKCYRRNADHIKAYSHPKRKADDEEDTPDCPTGGGDRPKKVKVAQDATSPDKSAKSDVDPDNTSQVPGKTDSHKEDEEMKQDEGIKEDEEDVSDSEEDEDVDASPMDVKQYIKHKYLVEMPQDFYDFWEFCKTEDSAAPTDVFKRVLGFQLVGPFDILAGKHEGVTHNAGKKPNFLRHWRYYYDPPEFLTVVRGDDDTQFHIGYFRDDPKEMPVFLAANSAKTSCVLSPRGDNLFAAVSFYAKDKLKGKEVGGGDRKWLEGVCRRLEEKAGQLGLSLDMRTKSMKTRQKKVVCNSFHGAGIVVPVDENEIGYRPVPETPSDLKKILKKIVDARTEKERNQFFDPLQELITLVQFANDECDYGEGLELGMDLFSYGGKVFHSTILHLLPLAYQLLRRTPYAKIISTHLRHRRHTADLSELG
ncbi:histone PARylation factor 1-like [Haliotis rubra]|uniref:histone PARylation factor 1-like n=1 Tax=Haliotis rubra TaxID=36100 RepID=UPI001EE4FA55|nr:histone PARylation factor 1-like [Haliotis rubra]